MSNVPNTDKPTPTVRDHRPPAPPASVMQRVGAASTNAAFRFWFPGSAETQSDGAS